MGAAFSGAAASQVPRQPLRHIHLGAAAPGPAPTPSSSSSSSLVPRPPVPHEELFGPGSEAGPQDKARFVQAVRAFGQRNAHRRGHVDFIYLALRKMRDFGLERDRAAYHLLLDVFPKDVFRARSFLQRLFVHYPRQQECGLAVLEQMENHGVMPNRETEFLLLQVFGKHSHPMRKLLRMRLWFSRFRAANPFPLPRPLPRDPLRLAGLGLRRLEPDRSARITVYQTPAPPDSTDAPLSPEPDRPHIVGIQSPEQQEALGRHDPARPVFVEGPFPLWLRDQCVHYHVLRADPLPPEDRVAEETPEERNLYYPMQLDLEYGRGPWDDYEFDIDEVAEGPVFAMCIAGARDQATLARWVQGLQETNPTLAGIPVLFRLASSTREPLASSSELAEQPPPSPPPPEGREEQEDNRRQQQGQG